MRYPLVAGNWKMHKDLAASQQLTSEIVGMVGSEADSRVQVVVAPPLLFLRAVNKLLAEAPGIALGAQNCHEANEGAFTGEISAPMLRSVGVQYVIIGHSERRQHFGETDAQLARKVNAALAHGLTPIFCCGETLEIREANTHFDFVRQQLTDGLFHLEAAQLAKLVLAYEPIWAIGTGRTASAQQAQEMHAALRAHLAERYGPAVADQVRILYGGSVKPDNAAEIFAQPDVDGGLIGGASLQSRSFVDIVKAAAIAL